MSKATKAETDTGIACKVCNDPLGWDDKVTDDDLGFVCKTCKWNLRIAAAHLETHGMPTCERRK